MSEDLPALTAAVHVVRGQRVMLDSDLAALYGVETKRLNEQVRRNVARFPDAFMLQLIELSGNHDRYLRPFGLSLSKPVVSPSATLRRALPKWPRRDPSSPSTSSGRTGTLS
jgi:hypothetical protein